MPRLKPYSRSATRCSGVAVAEQAADLGAAGEQKRRLAADDLEVLFLGDGRVAGLGELVELAFDHPQRDVAQQAHDLERVLRERHRHRADVEVVAEQHRDVAAPPRVRRQPAAARLGAVDDVVVDERRRVDELDDGRVEHGAVAGVAAEARGHQQHGRADALAAAHLDVLAHLRESARRATRDGGRTRARRAPARRGPARRSARDPERTSVDGFTGSGRACGLTGDKTCRNQTIGFAGVSTRRTRFAVQSSRALTRDPDKRSEVRGDVRRPVAAAASPRASASVAQRLRDPRRLVALAAMRHRRQKRRVGFDEQPIGRHERARRRAARSAFGNVRMPDSEM